MTNNLHVIVGLGETALSCARFFTEKNIPFAVNDTRENPANLAVFQKAYPHISISLGKLDEQLLASAAKLIVSPGVSIHLPAIAKQSARGIPVIGDIELFAEVVAAPVIAITGTNAKSTVTTLVGKMAEAAGVRVKVGGNLGVPALDLLSRDAELYVLELSSFQLETTFSLAPKVAALLNITPDHLDRHITLQAYQAAKKQVYSQAEVAVFNRDDALTTCDNAQVKTLVSFGLQEPAAGEFGLKIAKSETFLAYGTELLMPVRALPVLGRHYQANALAALAIGHSFGLKMDAMLKVLAEFTGLAHRCQLVLKNHGVSWYNDSKGTNVGATLAAIEGLGPEIDGKLVLIAGGLGKNADFSPLVPVVEKYAKAVVLIGEAAPLLADLMKNSVDVHRADSMPQAVTIANQIAVSGDSVLLSPACASWDMFKNFEHRGEVFTAAVQELV